MKTNKKVLLLAAIASISLVASAQTVLTVDEGTKSVSGHETGLYDRVEEAWKLEKGNTYLIAMPAQLDGYYFGPDAARLKVVSYEKSGDQYVVTTSEMDDLEDFLPNEAYLITPVIDVNKIVHVTPGIKTMAVATPKSKELLLVGQDNIKAGIKSLFADESGSACVYDLQGRKVSVMKRGETYIVNGKKVMVK